MLWIRNDRTGELFPNKYAASEALGICPSYVAKIAQGKNAVPRSGYQFTMTALMIRSM